MRKKYTTLKLSSLAIAALLVAACGGGGGDSPAPAASSTNLQSTLNSSEGFPGFQVSVGDYWVESETSFLSANTASSVVYSTDTFTVVGDLFVVAETNGDDARASLETYDSQARLLKSVDDEDDCDFSPALQLQPAKGALPSSTFSASSTVTCSDSSGASSQRYGYTAQVNGTAIGFETVNTAAGAFRAFRYDVVYTAKATSASRTVVASVWIDAKTGQEVKSNASTSSKNLITGATTNEGTSNYEVVAYASAAGGASPLSVKRFAGYWEVELLGSGSGLCQVLISGAGNASGSCQIGNSATTAAGSVSASGAMSLSLSNATTLNGRLDDPLTGDGTWVRGGLSGLWTANHF
jgi:hypothetical protein